jgi:hypothetical protein
LGLHALRIAFPHPATTEVVAVEAPLPSDFASALAALGMPYSASATEWTAHLTPG